MLLIVIGETSNLPQFDYLIFTCFQSGTVNSYNHFGREMTLFLYIVGKFSKLVETTGETFHVILAESFHFLGKSEYTAILTITNNIFNHF